MSSFRDHGGSGSRPPATRSDHRWGQSLPYSSFREVGMSCSRSLQGIGPLMPVALPNPWDGGCCMVMFPLPSRTLRRSARGIGVPCATRRLGGHLVHIPRGKSMAGPSLSRLLPGPDSCAKAIGASTTAAHQSNAMIRYGCLNSFMSCSCFPELLLFSSPLTTPHLMI